jgi:transposase
LFDGTNLLSKSQKRPHNRKGYNSHHVFDPQINLLYAFVAQSKMPAYYRIIPGNVREVSAFKLSISEADLYDAIVIGDKGFGSNANFEMLDEARLNYVVPLKRNSILFDVSRLKTGNKADFDGCFMFNECPIWYYTLGEGVVVFLDEALKREEEKHYLRNIEEKIEGYLMEGFLEGQYKFGTIILKTNVSVSAKKLYELYKARGEIEQMFDFLKNLLEQDRSYMQNEYSLETWAFINHISLMLTYRIYSLLQEKGLLSVFSVADFLAHLKYIFKVKINDEWHISETTKKTRQFLEKLNLHIT